MLVPWRSAVRMPKTAKSAANPPSTIAADKSDRHDREDGSRSAPARLRRADNRRASPRSDRRGGSCADHAYAGAKTSPASSQRTAGWARLTASSRPRKRVRRLVLDEVVGQNPCRLVARRRRRAGAPAGVGPDRPSAAPSPIKPAVAFPGNEIDMHIRLDQSRAGPERRGAVASAKSPRMPQSASNAESESAKRFHGGTRTGSARARTSRQARPAGGQLAGHLSQSAVRAGNSLFFADAPNGSNAANRAAAPQTLRTDRQLASQPASSRFGIGGDHRERHRHLPAIDSKRSSSCARRHRVVVAPPQRCRPSRFLPAVELVDQIGPFRASSSTRQQPVMGGSYR